MYVIRNRNIQLIFLIYQNKNHHTPSPPPFNANPEAFNILANRPKQANDYQHIIPFFGIAETVNGLGFVTLLCKNGKILDYIEAHKQSWPLLSSEAENRVKLVSATVV